MASLQQEVSGALGVQYPVSFSCPKARDVNTRLDEFADLLSQDKYCFDSECEQCLSSRFFEYKLGSAPIVFKISSGARSIFGLVSVHPWVLYIITFRQSHSFYFLTYKSFFQ